MDPLDHHEDEDYIDYLHRGDHHSYDHDDQGDHHDHDGDDNHNINVIIDPDDHDAHDVHDDSVDHDNNNEYDDHVDHAVQDGHNDHNDYIIIFQAKKGKYCCPVYVNQARWGEVSTIIVMVEMVMSSLHHPHKEWQLSN